MQNEYKKFNFISKQRRKQNEFKNIIFGKIFYIIFKESLAYELIIIILFTCSLINYICTIFDINYINILNT